MGVFGGRRAVKVETVAEWIASYLLGGGEPAEGTADREDFVAAVFLAGHEGERDLWLQYEGELLARWAETRPGTRPWAWWRFSAPEGRRQVAGSPILRGALHDQVDGEGLPLAVGEFPHGRVAFESEAECLRRLNVLAEAEAGRVKRSQYRPRTFKALTEDELVAASCRWLEQRTAKSDKGVRCPLG